MWSACVLVITFLCYRAHIITNKSGQKPIFPSQTTNDVSDSAVKQKPPPPPPPPQEKNIVAASFSPASLQMQPPCTNLQSSITALNLESIESIKPFLFISLAKNNPTSELHLSQGKKMLCREERERERNLSKHCVEFPSLFTKVCKIQSIEVINLQFVHSYTICSA